MVLYIEGTWSITRNLGKQHTRSPKYHTPADEQHKNHMSRVLAETNRGVCHQADMLGSQIDKVHADFLGYPQAESHLFVAILRLYVRKQTSSRQYICLSAERSRVDSAEYVGKAKARMRATMCRGAYC